MPGIGNGNCHHIHFLHGQSSKLGRNPVATQIAAAFLAKPWPMHQCFEFRNILSTTIASVISYLYRMQILELNENEVRL